MLPLVPVLEKVCLKKGFPEMIRSDNGSEFIAQAVNDWLDGNGKPIFIDPENLGKMAKEKVSMENCAMNF